MLLIIGSYSEITDPGIHLFHWEADEKRFIPIGSIQGIENPSYLSVDNSRRLIYAITEKKKDDDAELRIYRLENQDGCAELVSCSPYKGAGSCYICCDASRKHAFINNYGDGTLCVIELTEGQRPGKVVQLLSFSGTGPDKERQDQSHLHAGLFSKDERYLFCSDLGADRIYQLKYAPEAGKPLDFNENPYLELPPGSGPRHLVSSLDGKRMYVITELSGEIFVFDMQDLNKGWLQQISLVQAGYSGKVEAADVQLHPDGTVLYASNRGQANEIVIFSIDPLNGQLEFMQRIGAAGLSPRSLLICEQQGLVLVANEQSDNISIFNLLDNGCLEYTGKHLEVPCPTCLKAIP